MSKNNEFGLIDLILCFVGGGGGGDIKLFKAAGYGHV